MMNRVLSLAGLAAAALSLAAGCQSYPPPPSDYLGNSYTERQRSPEADELLKDITTLSLPQAQQIAIANNPSYIAAYYAITAARMRYLQAVGAYSPTISSSFQLSQSNNWYTHRNNSTSPDRNRGFATGTAVSANWVLFDGLAREFTMWSKDVAVDQQKSLTEDQCRLMLRAVAFAYNEVLLAIENKRIAVEDMEFQVENLRVTEIKYEAGAVPLSDVLNFRIQANVAEGNQITAEYQYEVALYALAVLMGYPEGTLPPSIRFPLINKLDLNDIPSVDIYLDNAVANRPDLRSYREQLKISEYDLYTTYSAFSPTLSAFAEFGYNTTRSRIYNDHAKSNSGQNSPGFTYGLVANWTLFNGLIRYNRSREAQAALAAANFQLADTWLTVVKEVRNAHINYVQSVKQAKLYEKTLEITTKQRDLVDDEYKAGNTELTRLNEAQRDLVDAQTTLASAYVSVQNAKAQLIAAAAMDVAQYGRAPKPFASEASEAAEPAAAPARPEAPAGNPPANQAPAAKQPTAKQPEKMLKWDPDNLAI